MCGIIGYIGRAEDTAILMDGLRRLEYRGYDSAGIALVANGAMQIRKCAGRIGSLADLIQKEPQRAKKIWRAWRMTSFTSRNAQTLFRRP
jgi:glutamine---fructose-6-phosphate transaminase (isomerizing)